ncbi:peptidase S8/S53 domain-containing protein [Lasiosphaeris hirsuta]|uniref:Peptidase S8/S53 domain-containing protein n=1 Tax=Lasiosphaeris hirsuta TaxID=260670 RepID=A0AA39ZV91_9PEZI|nr:peptidase S8/S53 domain-containing protein [Lasiosphaeris hirsuta]
MEAETRTIPGHGAKLPAAGPYVYKYNDKSSGKGVIAYVIDTGINDKNVQFGGRATKGPKFVTDLVPGTVTNNNDNQGHGTHCAGIIGSKDYGVAKDVEIIGIKVFFHDLPHSSELYGATNSDIMAALNYIVKEYQRHKHPSVVNLSLGGGVLAMPLIALLPRPLGLAWSSAALPEMRRETSQHLRQAGPPLAITVAASDIKDSIAGFSNFGKMIDVIAPGVEILSTWIGLNNTKTESISGTSIACPHVAGIISSILSDPEVVDKSPFNATSELNILADKNKSGGITVSPHPSMIKTANALSQVPY